MDSNQKSLYSRQIGTIGLETQQKLSQLRVFVYGLDSIGFEVVKCLTLMGVKKIYICPVVNSKKKYHIGRNFHLRSEEDLKNINQYSVEYFSQLNPYVEFEVISLGQFKDQDIDVFIQTKLDRSKPEQIAKYCSQKSIKYILGINISYSGLIFCDFGPNHLVTDWDGERRKHSFVLGYENRDNATYLKLDDPEHQFYPGIQFTFNISESSLFKITSLSDDWVKIDKYLDIAYLSKIQNLNIEEFKPQRLLNHISLEQYLKKVNIPEIQFNITSVEKSKGLIADFKRVISNPSLIGKSSIDLPFLYNTKYELSPLGMAIGSIVAGEVMKVTGKYTPISQDFLIDYSELKPIPKELYQTVKNREYEDLYRLLSKKIIKNLDKSNIFIAGCGALGCEYLKALSMLDVARINTKRKYQSSKITVTDTDHIELSNLNRQFLFGQGDIGKSKSQTASSKIKHYHPTINIQSYDKIINTSTETFFNRKFWQKQDLIINALDNISARQFIDNKCVIHDKSLFEAGTLGNKCNIQLIIPKQTKTYSETQDPPEKSIPMCTIKNFPYKIEHCIEWSMEVFHTYLHDFIIDLREYSLGEKHFREYLSGIDNNNIINQKLDNLILLTRSVSVYGIQNGLIRFSCLLFQKLFLNPIEQILHSFPKNHKNSEGGLFWSGNKIAPMIINIANQPQLYLQFVQYFTRLLSECIGYQATFLPDIIKIEDVLSIPLKKFVPDSSYQFKIKDSDKVTEGVKIDNLGDVINHKHHELFKYKIFANNKFQPISFEKDNDLNGHIKLITNISNLRAVAYSISQTNHLECKLIAGKVIPALSTTTTLVTSLGILELLKYFHYDGKSKHLSDHFINMGINTYLQSDPQRVNKITSGKLHPVYGCPVKVYPETLSIWDKKIISKKLDRVYNILDLVTFIEDQYDFSIDMLTMEDNILYSKHSAVQENRVLLSQYTFLEKPSSEYLEITVAAFSEEGMPIIIPKILYCWDL